MLLVSQVKMTPRLLKTIVLKLYNYSFVFLKVGSSYVMEMTTRFVIFITRNKKYCNGTIKPIHKFGCEL